MAISLVSSLAAAHLGSVVVTQSREKEEGLALHPSSPLPKLLLRSIGSGLLLLALPLIIITLNALRVRNCDYLEGLAFFAMIPVLSTVISSAMGTLWGICLCRPILATLAALFTIATSLAWTFFRFYDSPSVFAYDPFFGYFPGVLYDEDVAIRSAFFFSRLYNFVWLASAILLSAQFLDPFSLRLRLKKFKWRPFLATPTAILLLSGITISVFRAPLGISIDAEFIATHLGGIKSTAHFDILYDADIPSHEAELMAQDHEFRYAQLKKLFKKAPPKIRSFVFRSSEQKRRLMGAARVYIAKPWRKEIYLNQDKFPHRVLKHELAHVFAGLFGDRIFGTAISWRSARLLSLPLLGFHLTLPYPSFNVGLAEGIAVAADWPSYAETTAHEQAAALIRIGLAPPLENLFGLGFWGYANLKSYVYSGSFCRFLLERYGVQKLMDVHLSGGDFTRIYGQDLSALGEQWKTLLDKLPISEAQLQLAKARFHRPSVFKKVCAHEIANLQQKAYKLEEQGKHLEAANVFSQICDFDPSTPDHLAEKMQALVASGKNEAALKLKDRLLNHPAINESTQRWATEKIGDLHWQNNYREKAAQSYEQATKSPALSGDRRTLAVKRWGVTQPEQISGLVRDYIVPKAKRSFGQDMHLAYSLHFLDSASGLGLYLVGKQLAAHDYCQEAISPMKQALNLPLLSSDFVIEGLRVLGRCQYIAGQLEQAHETYEELSNFLGLPSGIALDAADWIERIEFRRTQH
ncbi:MAG: hypothetical protein V1754_10870 [Pseudomonadota bacterium]